MMIKHLYLIRHGEKAKQSGDPPLSELGNKQAQLTAICLKSLPITKIVASPSLRTKQTALHIANQLGLNLEINDLLQERANWGDNPKQPFNDFLSIWKRASKERNWQPPIGDSSIQSGKRLEKFIIDSLMYKDEHLAVITHGGIISDFLRNVFTDDTQNQQIGNFDFTLDSFIKECSITEVQVNLIDSKIQLITFADTSHL
jgi:broad specificity phosphatase PhoE